MMTKELSDKCWKTQSKRWHLLIKTTRTRERKKKEEDSAMAALMRSADEEIETNCTVNLPQMP